jgi:hypothetical protein
MVCGGHERPLQTTRMPRRSSGDLAIESCRAADLSESSAYLTAEPPFLKPGVPGVWSI